MSVIQNNFSLFSGPRCARRWTPRRAALHPVELLRAAPRLSSPAAGLHILPHDFAPRRSTLRRARRAGQRSWWHMSEHCTTDFISHEFIPHLSEVKFVQTKSLGIWDLMVSRSHGLTVSRSHGLTVSESQDSGFHYPGSRVLGFSGSRVLGFSCSRGPGSYVKLIMMR